MRSLRSALLCGLLTACSGTAPPPTPPPDREPTADPEAVAVVPETREPGIEDDPTPDGPPCDHTSDCEDGAHCRGPVGCEAAWACGEPLACGDAQIGWCGCDGFTFYAPEGCPGRRYVHTGPCEALGVVDEEPLEEVEGNSVCQSSADCPQGFECAGVEGCSTLWTCVRRARIRPRCTSQQETFCSCEGDSFQASSTCPGRPFLHRGYCPGDEPPVVEGADAGTPAIATPAPPPPSGPRVCVRDRDCPRGLICQGTEGCASDWHCERPRERCIVDTQYFCSCGGEIFTASMTCPGRPHRHRGSCTAEERR